MEDTGCKAAKCQTTHRCKTCVFTQTPVYLHTHYNNSDTNARLLPINKLRLAVYMSSRDQSDLVSRCLALRVRATIQYLRIYLPGILVASHPKTPMMGNEQHIMTERILWKFYHEPSIRPFSTIHCTPRHLCLVNAPILHVPTRPVTGIKVAQEQKTHGQLTSVTYFFNSNNAHECALLRGEYGMCSCYKTCNSHTKTPTFLCSKELHYPFAMLSIAKDIHNRQCRPSTQNFVAATTASPG